MATKQNIPQPSPGDGELTSQYTSTEAAPHGPTVSAIGHKEAPPVEVAQHVLYQNTLDRYMKEQFMVTARFTWTNSDIAGKLLWYAPIHPRSANQIVAHVMEIHNAWGGGIEYQFNVCGTGFHAGKLQFARIPPNRHPEEFQGDYSWTAFEHKTIDVKTLEAVCLHGGDQRQVNYHYTTQETEDPKSWEIGGYIACYVKAGLNTIQPGAVKVQVVCETRLAPNFVFSQPIFRKSIGPDPIIEAADIERVLDFTFYENRRLRSSASHTAQLYIAPSTEKELWVGSMDTVPFSGLTHIADRSYKFFIGPQWDQGNRIKSSINTLSLEVSSAVSNLAQLVMLSNDLPITASANNLEMLDYSLCYLYNRTANSSTGHLATSVKKQIRSGNVLTIEFNDKFPDGWSEKDALEMVLRYPFTYLTQDQVPKDCRPPPLVPPVEESFIGFGPYGKCTQTLNLATFLASGNSKTWLPQGMAALFVCMDAQDNTPLFLLKMYKEGYFTAATRTSGAYFDLSRIQFKFQSFIGETQPIPPNAPGALPALTALKSAAYMKELRHQSKRNPTEQDELYSTNDRSSIRSGS